MQEHSELCFSRAFPRPRKDRRQADEALKLLDSHVRSLPKSQQEALAESGIAGTSVRYRFSFEIARWLARNVPGAVSIDWHEFESTEPLDDLLRLLLQPSEDEYFDSGYATTKEWVTVASSGYQGTDFDWLMAQLGECRSCGACREASTRNHTTHTRLRQSRLAAPECVRARNM
jgi:hypothetical protein